MEIDIIEVRVGNYFEWKRQVKQIDHNDLAVINVLIKELKPIEITPLRLTRLNFALVTNSEYRLYQKFSNKIYFNFHRMKNDRLLLIINDVIKLPDVKFIHQLQNVYYDLSGDVLLLPEVVQPKRIPDATGLPTRYEIF